MISRGAVRDLEDETFILFKILLCDEMFNFAINPVALLQ
jgi:hypothetical protein